MKQCDCPSHHFHGPMGWCYSNDVDGHGPCLCTSGKPT